MIKESIETASRFIESELGIPILTTTVLAYADLDRMVDAKVDWYGHEASRPIYRNQIASGYMAEGGRGVIFLYTGGSPGWQQRTELQRRQTLAHEYFHVVQNHLVRPVPLYGKNRRGDISNGGPEWLIEGTAEYIAQLTLSAAQLSDFKTAKEVNRLSAQLVSEPLVTFDTLAGALSAERGGLYSLGFMAADFLLSSQANAALTSYWRTVGDGKPWQSAFESSFGRDIDTFYIEFAKYRREAFPAPAR